MALIYAVLTPRAVRAKLARLGPSDVAGLIVQHADRPFTRRAAEAGLIRVDGVRESRGWFVLQVRVQITDDEERIMALTMDRAGNWRCGQLTAPIVDPASADAARLRSCSTPSRRSGKEPAPASSRRATTTGQ